MLIRRSTRFHFPLRTVRLCQTGRSDDLPMDSRDVSPVVHQIAGIVLSEDPGVPLEDSLSAAGVAIDAEVAETVLKRCLKAPVSALRFFDWVGRRPGFRHTAETYNSMIHIAGEARDFDLVKDLLARMDTESVKADVKTWTTVVSQYGKAGLLGGALLSFEKMRSCGVEADEAVYSSLVRALCEGKKIELALEFYREMAFKGMKLDEYVYRLLMTGLAGSGDVGSVRSIADDMAKVAGMTEYAVNSSMLKSFCVSGRMEEALELVWEIRTKNVCIDNQQVQILVDGLCRAGRIDDALEFVGEVEKENVSVGTSVYESLIDSYSKRGNILIARELLDNWKKLGFIPSISLYTTVIQRLFCLNEYAEACKLYEEMKANGIEPDVVAVTALVAGHVRHGYISEALEVFEGMKSKGLKPTRKAYSVFINELCKASETEVARKVFDEMRGCGLGVGNELSRLARKSMDDRKLCMTTKEIKLKMNAYRVRNQEIQRKQADLATNSSFSHEDVDGLLPVRSSEMSSNELHQLSSSEFDQAGNECFNEGDLMEVTGLLSSSCDWTDIQDALEKSGIHFSSSLVVEILHNCRRHGSAAMKFFSWVARKPGYQHTVETYNMAIKIAGSGKDFKYMRMLFEEMEGKGCEATADTWTIMLTQYGRAGLTKMALQKFKEMKAGKCKPKGSTYKYLILFLCERKGRNVDEAIKLSRKMIRAGFTPDKELAETYLLCLCETENLTEARAFVESVCRKCFTSQISYSMLVKALCRAGRLEEAASLVDELENLGCVIDQYIYGSLVHGLLRGGKHDDALAKVGKMKEEGIVPTVHVYTSLISYYFKTKQMENVAKILGEMREDGCPPSIITYCTLIRGYMDEGRVIDAWSVFRMMKLKGPFPDFKTYSMFITCLCKVGRSEEGLQLLHEMIETGIVPSTVNFRTVFYGLNREGKPDLARSVLQVKWALMRSRKCWL
ncbi:putative pentatricopeptide repeat-containing protein At5g06400, mitochondrial [Nymphaea colorata]|uniref:Uncharacterized protein n=1 Tax=Nymphaea colorata TaxID=210225 RepID=A0A5K1AED5_9MAGN|nr:putative pentatricopeptide repeat-containing protein At5g06400, mitochondrial [Nymphaea colorata]